MLFLIFMFLSTLVEHTTPPYIQRSEQVPIELDISAIEEYVIIIIIIIRYIQLLRFATSPDGNYINSLN